MKTSLQPMERLVKEGGANLQRGAEAVGGHLYLTNLRLIFESHAFNVQTGSTEISLASIQAMTLCWTKFLGSIPIFPNSLAVTTADGAAYSMVLNNRKEWLRAIAAGMEEQRLLLNR